MPHLPTFLLVATTALALWAIFAVLTGLMRIMSARRAIRGLVDTHIETLARRKLALVKTDHYGIVDEEAWRREYRYFIDKVVLARLAKKQRLAIAYRREALLDELIDGPVERRRRELRASLSLSHDISPAEFEQWCTAALREAGWNARSTGASGDQGADVIAEKGGICVVLQCKLHKSTIGNKAVQEAFAAQQHYGAQAAAVVTNAGFTRSAEALSRTTGVLLFHYSDLARLGDLLEAARSRSEENA
jgi:restriction system protein